MIFVNIECDPLEVCFIEKKNLTHDQLQLIRSAHGKSSDFKGFKGNKAIDAVSRTIFEIIPALQKQGLCSKVGVSACQVPPLGIISEIVSCTYTP